jgi:hypothetical protein
VDTKKIVTAEEQKRDWVRPQLHRIEAGAAESNFSGAPDASAPQAS